MKTQSAKLLAPAGGPEAGYAAFRYGADAVYCGLRDFSARAEAVNFSPDELRELASHAHARPRRGEVFVTLNTLMAEAEIPAFADAICTAAECGADALIVQDLGVARLARAIAPDLPLHASTQMAIHNLEGALAARRWGFSQITLARELTFDEIRAIAAAGVPVEVFIHGALCYSYSGLCLMSAMRNGRSGNRGRCAYPCRDRYAPADADSGGGLAFSMKDLALGETARDLAAMGVACLKIEGRMKSPLYVAAVTDYYRRILDGAFRSEHEVRAAEEDLQTIFSRKWTRLHSATTQHAGVIDPEATGHRGARIGEVDAVASRPDGPRWLRFRTSRALQLHDGIQIDLPGQDRPYGFSIAAFEAAPGRRGPVFECPAGAWAAVPLPPDAPRLPAGAAVYCASSQAVKQHFDTTLPPQAERKPRLPLDLVLEVRADALRLRARSGGLSAEAATADTYSPARNPERNAASIAESCAKLGETGFALAGFVLDNPDDRFAPVSQVNDLRRQVCARLADGLAAESARRHAEAAAIAAARLPRCPDPAAPTRWSVRTDQPACLDGIADADEVVLDLDPAADAGILRVADRFGRDRIRLALPLVLRSWERDALRARIDAFAAQGFHRWLATNPDAWDLLPEDHDIEADWTLSAWNSQAITEWFERGVRGVVLSPETELEDAEALVREWGDVATVVLHQDVPLMISEACPISALGAVCGNCGPKRGLDETRLRAARGGDVVVATHDCRAVVMDAAPLDRAGWLPRLAAAGARRWRVDFRLRSHSADDAASIWRRIRGRAD